MSSKNVLIKYQGFSPSEMTKEYMNSVCEHIAESLPRNTKIKVTFSKKRELFKGMVQLNSAEGVFFSTATDINLKVIAEKILTQVRRQRDKWKTKHKDHTSLRDLSFDMHMAG